MREGKKRQFDFIHGTKLSGLEKAIPHDIVNRGNRFELNIGKTGEKAKLDHEAQTVGNMWKGDSFVTGCSGKLFSSRS